MRRRHAALALGVLALLLFSAAAYLWVTSAGAAQGDLLWTADHETGDLSQWSGGGGEFHSGNAGASASREVARSGEWSLKMSIRTPPESGARLFRWREAHAHLSTGLYYTVWLYFPHRFEVSGWWSVMQWKSRNPSRNDPFFMVDIKNRADGSMYLYLYNWTTTTNYEQSIRDLPVGRWVKVEAFYQCGGEGEGRIILWQDGVQLFDLESAYTRFADGDCGWSVNNYGSGISPTPTVIYADDAAISRTRMAEAQP